MSTTTDLAVFFAARMEEDQTRHRDGVGHYLGDVRGKKWLFDEWNSMRAEADRIRRDLVGDEPTELAAKFDALAGMYEPAIRMFAEFWDHHPDYDEAWRS